MSSSPGSPSRDTPRGEYEARWAERRRAEAYLARRSDALGNVRLLVFLGGLALLGLVLFAHLLSGWWLFVPVFMFVGLAVHHERIFQERKRAARAAAFYEQGLRRLNDDWAGMGTTTGERFADPAHPYSGDLDLFGRGSLFELLCAARTKPGEERLAQWLLSPTAAAAPAALRERQQAVGDMRPRLDLREDLATLGEEAQTSVRASLSRKGGNGMDAAALAAWGASTSPASLTSAGNRIAALVLAGLAGAAGLAWAAGYSALPFVLLVFVGQAFQARLGGGVKQVLRAVESAGRDLEMLSLLLARLEREEFSASRLRTLSESLGTGGSGGETPSGRIAGLRRRIDLLSVQENPLVAPFAFVLLWRTHCAFAIEAWRRENGPRIAGWIETVAEFEALSSLAGYAYENPDDVFPQIIEDSGGPLFEAQGLAHPLLPVSRAVANDVSLGPQMRLLLVSGSNMSGKSTLLRSVGVSVVLALAGAPVRARSLRLSPLTVGASLRTQDSLQGGVSRFYAEIQRLRQVVELADARDSSAAPPLLFLLDEILHGTNSHDRRIGAEAIVRALSRRGAIGLVTTHDLALTQIVEDAALRAANVHFEDQLTDGVMSFDYRLRPGVVEKSNALALMRAVGLEV